MSFINKSTEGMPLLTSVVTLANNTNTTQALALPLAAALNVLPVGHAANAAYILPTVDADHLGAVVIVVNNAAAVANIFPGPAGVTVGTPGPNGSTSGATIDAAAADAAVAQIANSVGIYFAVAAGVAAGSAGNWRMFNVAQL